MKGMTYSLLKPPTLSPWKPSSPLADRMAGHEMLSR